MLVGRSHKTLSLCYFRATRLAGKQQDGELWLILVDLWVFIVLFLGLIHKNRPQIDQFTITSHGPSGIFDIAKVGAKGEADVCVP
jgi:hypothetical protein